eukprot:Lithocolla_globosa_v1_NODE_1650_length_2420_cov_9.449471.p1 type:complete len:520 gc:universal NODE_1650_length_2420_cov_9.449471:516-2075(+)
MDQDRNRENRDSVSLMGNERETMGLMDKESDERGKIEEDVVSMESKPWKYKLFALICACLLSVGSHYAAHMLSALKTTIKDDLGISNAQFGLLQGASALVNTVIPLFGGVFLDTFGTGYGSIVASSLIVVGEVFVALSANMSSFSMMVVGRLIYGMGSGTIVIVQESILAHWFYKREYAFVIGLQIAISRLSGFLATGTVVPIAEATGHYANAFWFSAGICFLSWLLNLFYVALLHHLGEHQTMEKLRAKLRNKKVVELGHLSRFNSQLWNIVFISFAFGLCWAPFMHISAELISVRFGSDEALSGWYAATALALPVVLSPLMGLFIDRYGMRPYINSLASFCLILSFTLIGYTYVNPTVAMLIFSVSLAIGPMSEISALQLVVPLGGIGTGLGVDKCASNIGTTLMDPLVGLVQDVYESYYQVMWMFIACAIFTFGLGLVMITLDHLFFKSLLTVPQKRRLELVEDEDVKVLVHGLAGRHEISLVTRFSAVVLFGLMLTSWGVYIGITMFSIINEEEP